MTPLFVFALFFAGLSVGYSDRCLNPEISSETFTTQDATIVTNIAYICEFQVRCKSGVAANLYAEIDGSIVPISVIGPNTHQVSFPIMYHNHISTILISRLAGLKTRKLLLEVIK